MTVKRHLSEVHLSAAVMRVVGLLLLHLLVSGLVDVDNTVCVFAPHGHVLLLVALMNRVLPTSVVLRGVHGRMHRVIRRLVVVRGSLSSLVLLMGMRRGG